MPPEGSSEITTSIGGRCKACKGFSRSVLISREAWPVILRSFISASRVSYIGCHPIGVARAEGSHLFPFRTEKLSPPAPMVLPGTPGGRVGRRPLNSCEEPRRQAPGLFRCRFPVREPAVRCPGAASLGPPTRTGRFIGAGAGFSGTGSRSGKLLRHRA